MTVKLNFQEVVISVLRMKQVRQQHLVPAATLLGQAPHQMHLIRGASYYDAIYAPVQLQERRHDRQRRGAQTPLQAMLQQTGRASTSQPLSEHCEPTRTRHGCESFASCT